MSKAYAAANAWKKKQQEQQQAQTAPKEQHYEQTFVQAVNSRERDRENAVRSVQSLSQRIADNDANGSYQGTLTDQHRRVNDLTSLRDQLRNLRTNFGLDVGDTADLDEAIKQQTKFVKAFKNDGEYRTGYWFGEKYKGSTRQGVESAMSSLENGNDAQKGEALWLKQHQYQYWNKDELQSEMQSKRAELKELKDQVNAAHGVGKSLAYKRYGDRIDTLKSEITAMSQALDSAALENELKKFTATELEKFWQYGEERTKMDDYATASGNSPAASLALAEHQKKADSVGQMLKKKGYSDAQIKTLMDYSVKAANAKSVQSQAEMLGKLADSGFWGKVAATGAAVALDFESGIGAIDIAAQNLFRGENAFTGEKTSVDYNTRTQQFGLASEAAKSAVTKDMGEFGQWLYNAGLSAVESIIGAYGMPGKTYELLMSGMAAQSAMQEMHRRGATDNQTVGVGLLAGLLEAAFEHASIENLRGIINAQKATGAGVKGFLQRSLLQAGVEASEEGFTSLANTAAELIFLQDKSELKSNINTYMQQGMTEEEATRKAGLEWLDSVLQDTAAGFVSGGIATMPANGRIAVSDRYYGQMMEDNVVQREAYLNAALAMDEKSPAYKVAKELEAEFEKGQNNKTDVELSRTKLGELYRKVNQQVDEDSKSERAQIERQMPKTQEAVFINAETGDVTVGVKASRVAEALIASGESAKNAVAMAPVIEKIVAGEAVTDAELKSMGVFSKAVADVVNTYTQSDIDPNNATESELIKAYHAAAAQQKTRIDDAAKMGEAIKEANAKLEAAKAEAEAQLAEQTAQVEAEAQAAIAEAEQSAPEQTQESAPSFRFTNGDVSQDLTAQDYIELVRKSNPNDARSDADLIEEFNSLLGHAAMNGGTIDAADVPNILREHRAATEATAKPKPKPKPKPEAAPVTVDSIAETLNSGKRKVEGYTVYRSRDTQRDGATITVKRPDGTNIKQRVENGRHMTNEQLNRIAAEIIAADMGLSTPATTPPTLEPKTEPKTEEPKAPAEEAKPESKEKVDRPIGEEIAKDIYFVAEEGNKVQKLSATQIRSLQLAMPVLRFAGVTKVIVDEKATQGTNAYIDEDTGIVRINPSELKSTWMIFWALGHEILHPATSDRNGQTNKMAERVIETFEALYSKGVLTGDLAMMVESYMNGKLLPNVKKQYSDFLGREVTDHYARQEIAGNMFGFIAESRPIMEKMAGYQPTLMTKVMRKLIAAREGITTSYIKDDDQRKATQAALDLLVSDINKALRQSKLAAFQPKTKAQERADRRAEKQATKTQTQNNERIEKVRERAKTADKGEPVAQSATPENKSVAKAMARLNKGAERTRSGRAALGIFPKGSTEHKAIEALGSGSEVITNGDDELVLAKSKDNHTVMYSLPTLFGTGRYYEEHPEAKSGIELLTQTLKDNGHSDDEIKEVIDGLTQAAQELMDLSDQIAEEYGWEGMREHLTMEIVTDIRDAQQVIYTLTPNGEYPVNLDLALVCKKRVAYTRILAQLVRDGVLDEVDFGSEAIAKVNQILRDSGFETACLGCFVEARRTAIQKWAEDFIYEWNKVVEEHDPNAGYFNFTYTTNPQTGERENTTPAISEKDVAALDRMYELNVLNKQGNVSLSSSTPLAKVEELFGKKMETGVLLKKLRPADLMTPEGIAAIKKTDKTLFNLVKARYGATQPKVLQEFHPYASDMANATFEEVARKTGKGIKGAETYREKAEEMLQREPNESDEAYEIRMRKLGVANLLDDADKQRRIDALAMRLYLYDIGGARIQSFSDFMIENTLDYLQIIADMSAARLPMHGYTKEIIAMKLFGMTGLKWNGSLIAHVDPSEDKNHAGLLPVSEASDGRGIVLTGPARVENGEIIGEKQWAICFDDYDRNERTSKPAKEYLAAHGGDEKKLGKAEAREYERLKRQASYIQSIGMKDIFALMMDPRYSKNIGNITIGVSDVQIIAMLRSDLFTMVIPYHKSGLPKIFAQLMGIENYNDYEPYQKTTVKQVYDKDGNPIDDFIRVGGKIVHADTEAFNFNAVLQEKKGDARAAADAYLTWCGTMHEIKDSKGNTLGYETFNPKFSNSPSGYNFTKELNYYKLLEDFTALDPVTGEWTPQGAVQQYEMNEDGTYDLTRSRLPSESNRLTDEQKAQYRERLRGIGIYTEAEIDKIIQKSDMTFAELVKAEAKNRGRYHHETDPRFDSTYKQIVEALTGKEYRGTRAERDAERQKKLDKKAEEKAKKAAAKAAAENAAGAQVGDGGIRFSLRTAPPPKKTQYGFKLMDVDENGLPHAMFIDADKPYEFGVWYDADSPALKDLESLEPGYAYLVNADGSVVPESRKAITKKGGRFSGLPGPAQIRQATANGQRWMAVDQYANGAKSYHNVGINGSGTVSTYALRPGIHAVDIPSMTHIGSKSNGSSKIDTRRPNQRWFLIEYPVDQDYNQEAYNNPGKDITDHIPTDGWYSFQTNTGAEKNQHWFITGAMKIVGSVSEADVRKYARDRGFSEDLPWKNGKTYSEDDAIDLDEYIRTTDAQPTPSKEEMRRRIEAESTGKRFSLPSDSVEMDRQYMDAVNAGDIQEAQRMVDEAAEAAMPNSTARGADGKLLRMYHGTSGAGFNVFDYGKRSYGLFGNGFYFTDSREVAEGYTNKGRGNNPGIYEVYLNITNPIDMDAPADMKAWRSAFIAAGYDTSYLNGASTNEDAYRALEEFCQDEGMYKYEAEEAIEDLLRGMGYDGLTHIGGGRYNKGDSQRHRVYIALDQEQIKSAEPITRDNDGDVISLSERFDFSKGDIRYSLPSDPVEMDRQYEAAVRSGDMDTAQRMVEEAARRAGYTELQYHGTDVDFTEFKVGDIGFHVGTEAQARSRLNDRIKSGVKPAKGETRPRIMKLYAKTRNPLVAAMDFGSWHGKSVALGLLETEEFIDGIYPNADEINARLEEIAKMPDVPHTDGVMRDFLKSLGFDSIIYGNEFEDMDPDDFSEFNSGDSILVFDADQLKSANPVVYDNDGNLIPLSERFRTDRAGEDEWKNRDIRFSLNPDLFLTEEYKTYYQELFSDKGLSPDAAKKARAAKRDEEISRIATTYKNFFDANERRRKGLRKGDLGYIPDTNSESMQRAEDRLDADFQGEYENLKKNGLNTDDDVDTAMGILAVLVADARTTKDYKTVADWLQRIRANATRAGQTVQAFAKYAQTPEGILVDAAEILAETDLSKADQGIILAQLAEFAKTLNAIKKGEEGNRDDLIDLILQQAEMRNTPVSNGTLKALYTQKIDYLYDAALNQMSQIAQDYLKPSLAKGMATYQTISHLFNARTAARNVVSNTVFSPVAAVANNLAVVPDIIISLFTKQRAVGFDRWWFSGKTWKGVGEGARRARVEVALDIDPRPNSRDKYGTSRRTWKMTGNAAARTGSRIEKLMGFELNWTDEFHKGAVEAEILQGLEGLVDKGIISQENAEEWARQEALYRSFQDDTFLSARLQDIKNLLNTVGFGHTGRYLGAKAQTPFNEIKEFGLGDLIQKYTQVPGALITRAVEFSPLGYVKMFANLAQMPNVNKALRKAEMRLQEAEAELEEEPDNAALINRVFQAQKSADAARFKAQTTQRMAALAMGRATTGVGLIKLFAMLAASGLMHRPDDDDDPNATAMLQSMGVTGTQVNMSALVRKWFHGGDGSWQKGDQLWAIDFLEPLNALMTIGVKIVKEAKDDKTFKDKLDSAQRGTLDGLWNVIGEIPTMQSLGTIQQTLRYYDPEQWPNRATAVGIELARGSATGFVPSVVRQTAQATDTVQRNTYTSKSALQMTKDQIQNTLPYFRNKLPEKLDNFGKPRKLENPLLNALNAYVIPGSIRTYQVSPEAQELVKVSGETGDVNIFPDRNAPSTVKISVEGQDYSYDLTAQQKQAYQAARGKYTYQFQHDMMRDPYYKGATTQEKNKMLTEAKQLGDYMAKKEFLAKQKGAPAYSDSAKEKTLKALGAGYTVASWVDVRDTANKAKGVDADGDGKTDSGSKKKAQLEIIQGLNLTDQQKTFWFRGSDYNGTDDGKDKIGDAANMSIAPTTYIDAVLKLADAHGVDNNGDGKTDSGSKMRNEADIINSLPLTIDQKRWLFFQLHETSTKFEAGYTWYDTSGN